MSADWERLLRALGSLPPFDDELLTAWMATRGAEPFQAAGLCGYSAHHWTEAVARRVRREMERAAFDATRKAGKWGDPPDPGAAGAIPARLAEMGAARRTHRAALSEQEGVVRAVAAAAAAEDTTEPELQLVFHALGMEYAEALKTFAIASDWGITVTEARRS